MRWCSGRINAQRCRSRGACPANRSKCPLLWHSGRFAGAVWDDWAPLDALDMNSAGAGAHATPKEDGVKRGTHGFRRDSLVRISALGTASRASVRGLILD